VANSATFELLATGEFSEVSINLTNNVTTICEKVTVEYCNVLESASKCATCNDNYFLTNAKTCQRYPESPIENCLKYSSAIDCVQCADTHYVKQESAPTPDKCILIPTVNECAEYNKLNGFCSKCNDAFYLNETLNSCIPRTFNPPNKCEVINPKADLCETCVAGATKVTNGTGCYDDPANCQTPVIAENMDVGAHFCSLCNNRFYPVNGVCIPTTINNCLTFISNRNACQECEHTHYISEAKDSCTAKNISGCAEFTDDDVDTCLKCDNLKYLTNSDKECTDITNKTNCAKSDGKADNCVECNPGIIRTVSGECTGTRTVTHYDTNCAGNSSTSDDSSCASCATGFIKLDTSNVKAAKIQSEMDTMKCLEIKSDGSGCHQCENGHQNNSGTCDIDPSSASVCKRMKPGATEALLTPGTNCEECKWELGYYLNGTTCTESTDYMTYLDCDEINPSTGACNKCKTGTYPVKQNEIFCANESFTPTKFSTVTECAVKKDFDKCHICNKEFIVNGAGTSCDGVTAGNTIMYNTFDFNMNQMGSKATATLSQCAEYAQIDENEFACIKCNAGFMGIVDRTKMTNTVATLARGIDYYYPFKECVAEGEMYKKADDTNHVAAADCLFGEQPAAESGGYGCLRCVNGKVGTFVEVSKKQSRGALDSGGSYIFVGDCVDSSSTGLRANFTGVSYNDTINAGGYLSSVMMPFSDCATSGEVVFYIAQWTANVGVVVSATTDGTNANKQAFCGTEAAKLADQTQKVEHCAIYAFGAAVPSTFNPASDTIATVRCRSCKPGYYISEWDTTDGVKECKPIHGCNTDGVRTSNENSWLNACSNPDSGGWKAETSGTLYKINYFDPMPNDSSYKINNCLAYLQSLEKCLVCKPGFMPNGKACDTITTENSNCTTSGMGLTGMSVTLNGLENQFQKSLFYSRFSYIRKYTTGASTYADFSNSLCNVCSGTSFLTISSGSNLVCGNRIGSEKKDSNCKTFSSGECVECNPNYSLGTGNVCKENTADPNCLNINSNGSCSVCKVGYGKDPNDNNKCRANLCHDPATCAMCASGKIVYDVGQKLCEDNPISNDDCEHYAITTGYCVKCKTAGKIPYNFKKTFGTNLSHYSCVTAAPATNGWLDLNMEYPYVLVENPSSNSYTATLHNFNTGNRSQRRYTSSTVGAPSESVCVPNRTVSDCTTLEYDVFCTACSSSKFLLNNNTCSNTPINHCTSPNEDRITCSACDSGYYLAADSRSCPQRVLSVNCATPTSNKDECDTCTAGSFVKNSSNICVAYTAENCRTFKASVDECDFCVDNAWMDTTDSNICKLSEDAQCVLMKEKENECKKCANGFYLKTNGLVQTCTQVTAENCATNMTHEDKCMECNTGYYMNGTVCTANSEIDFCTAYSQTADECLTCNDGYYSVSGLPECRKNPNGIAECYKYISETECTVCNPDYYLKDGTCHSVPNTINFCKYYKSETECSECSTGAFLTSPTKCDPYNSIVVNMCLEFASHERCKSCKVNSILNEETGLCESSGISGCVTATRGSPNLCQECEPGKFLSSNKQTCETPSTLIDQCYEYETQTKCMKCNENYLLSLNGSSCTALGDKAGVNCGWALETDKIQCDICEFGYQKNEIGECVKISESNCALLIGDKCGLCIPGMKMNKEGKCEDPNPPPPDKSVGVIKAFGLVYLILLVFR
jgi:hypothetical protein